MLPWMGAGVQLYGSLRKSAELPAVWPALQFKRHKLQYNNTHYHKIVAHSVSLSASHPSN